MSLKDSQDHTRPTGAKAALAALLLLGSILLAATPLANAASLSDLTAVGATQKTGATETWTFTFRTASSTGNGGDVRIVFPSSFTLALTSSCDIAGVTGETTVAPVGGAIVCQLGLLTSLPASTTVSLTISQVTNPTTALTTSSILVQTRDALDVVVDSASTTAVIAPSPLTSVTASAPSHLAGATETWTFGFTTTNTVLGGGDIRILFPDGFLLDGATSQCDVSAPLTVLLDSSTTTSSEATCTLGPLDTIHAGSSVLLTVSNIQNPPNAETSGPFTIQTRDAADAVHDQHASLTVETGANSLRGFYASAPSQLAGSIEPWTLGFTTTNPIPAAGDIRVGFPADFEVSPLATCDVLGIDGEATIVLANLVLCQIGANAFDANESVQLVVSGVQNPSVAGTTDSFIVETRNLAGQTIDEHLVHTVSILPNALSAVTATAPLRRAAATETWSLALTPANPVLDGGSLRIVFPEGFSLSSGATSACEAQDKTFTTSIVSGREILCTLQGSSLAGGELLPVNITNVQNPDAAQTTGAFLISTLSAADQLHDLHESLTVQIVPNILQDLAISAPTQGANAVETWSFDFTTLTPVAAGGDIRIVFPNGFNTSVGGETQCAATGLSLSTEVVSSTEVICRLSSGSLGADDFVSLSISWIQNPSGKGSTAAFAVQTRTSDGSVHGQDILNSETMGDAQLGGLSASAPLQRTGLVETWTLSFETVSPIGPGGDIRIVFPTGFSTSVGGTTVCDIAGRTGESTTVVNAREIICELNGAGIDAGTDVVITLSRIKNPLAAQSTDAFLVQTRDAADLVQDEHDDYDVTISASSLASVSASGTSNRYAVVESWTLRMTLFNPVAAGGDVRVVLPSGFQTSASGATSCDVSGVIGETTSVVSSSEVVCGFPTNGLSAGQSIVLRLTNLRNPPDPGATEAFVLQTRDDAGNVHDEHAGVTVTIVAGAIRSVAFSAPIQATGAVENWTLSYVPGNAHPAGSDVRVVFPSGFVLSSGQASVCDVLGKTGESSQIVSASELVCTLGADLAADQTVSIQISHVRNPLRAQTTGAFTLQLRNPADAVRELHTSNVESIVPHAFRAGPTLWLNTSVAGAAADYRLNFTLFNDWPAQGQLRIQLPNGYAAPTEPLIGLADNATGVLANASYTSNVLLLQRLGATSVPSGSAVSLLVRGLENPDHESVGRFRVTTMDPAGVPIDEGSISGWSFVGARNGPSIEEPVLEPMDPSDWDTDANGVAAQAPPAAPPPTRIFQDPAQVQSFAVLMAFACSVAVAVVLVLGRRFA